MDNYYEQSDCGKYRVAATSTAGKWLFGAWLVGNPSSCLGQFFKADEARNACMENAGELKVAVEELKQIAGADGLYAGAGK